MIFSLSIMGSPISGTPDTTNTKTFNVHDRSFYFKIVPSIFTTGTRVPSAFAMFLFVSNNFILFF